MGDKQVDSPKPPDFLGKDTSEEQLKKVPYFYLGLPATMYILLELPKVASFRQKDNSGNLVFSHKVRR